MDDADGSEATIAGRMPEVQVKIVEQAVRADAEEEAMRKIGTPIEEFERYRSMNDWDGAEYVVRGLVRERERILDRWADQLKRWSWWLRLSACLGLLTVIILVGSLLLQR